MPGITDNKVCDHLLREKNLTLECTLDICCADEVSTAQQKEVDKVNDSCIHAVGKGRLQGRKTREKKKPRGSQNEWITDCRF